MKNHCLYKITLTLGISVSLAVFLFPLSAYAVEQGVAEWTTHLLKGPFSGLGYAMNAISFIVGVGFILGSYIQYQAHRDNPQQVRISTPIFLLVAGLVLVGLPMLSWVAEGGSFLRPPRTGYTSP